MVRASPYGGRTMAENFRREPIRSRRYLDGSRGQPCTLEITACCIGGTETTVAAHIRDETHGRSIKADDISIADACAACHDALDGRGRAPLSSEEWLFYSLRGLQRTLRNRIERGLVVIPLDAAKLPSERPTKPRKPKADRAPIANRGFEPGPRQKIQSRPFKSARPT